MVWFKGGKRSILSMAHCVPPPCGSWTSRKINQYRQNPEMGERRTDCAVCKVSDYNILGALRVFSPGVLTSSELLEEESIFTEQAGDTFRAREWRERVVLWIVGRWLCHGIISVRERGIRTVFPMRRTGFLSFAGVYGGSCSTERTRHRAPQ